MGIKKTRILRLRWDDLSLHSYMLSCFTRKKRRVSENDRLIFTKLSTLLGYLSRLRIFRFNHCLMDLGPHSCFTVTKAARGLQKTKTKNPKKTTTTTKLYQFRSQTIFFRVLSLILTAKQYKNNIVQYHLTLSLIAINEVKIRLVLIGPARTKKTSLSLESMETTKSYKISPVVVIQSKPF